jgi:hypothetical protein
LTFIFGCSNDKKAEKIYHEAETSAAKKEFNKSKLLIDSILNYHSDNIEYTTRSKDLLRTITKAEQENNLAFLDSMLTAKQQELDPLMINFEESLEVGEVPTLIHKRQKIENSFSRSYIMANLNKNGDFYYRADMWGNNEYITQALRFMTNHYLQRQRPLKKTAY